MNYTKVHETQVTKRKIRKADEKRKRCVSCFRKEQRLTSDFSLGTENQMLVEYFCLKFNSWAEEGGMEGNHGTWMKGSGHSDKGFDDGLLVDVKFYQGHYCKSQGFKINRNFMKIVSSKKKNQNQNQPTPSTSDFLCPVKTPFKNNGQGLEKQYSRLAQALNLATGIWILIPWRP